MVEAAESKPFKWVFPDGSVGLRDCHGGTEEEHRMGERERERELFHGKLLMDVYHFMERGGRRGKPGFHFYFLFLSFFSFSFFSWKIREEKWMLFPFLGWKWQLHAIWEGVKNCSISIILFHIGCQDPWHILEMISLDGWGHLEYWTAPMGLLGHVLSWKNIHSHKSFLNL